LIFMLLKFLHLLIDYYYLKNININKICYRIYLTL